MPVSADVLYLKIDKNVQVKGKPVLLGEIASVASSRKEVENKVKTIHLQADIIRGPGRYVFSVTDVMEAIWKEYPGITIENLGESDFIITLENENHPNGLLSWGKTILVCLLSFFGAAFSIMAFNNDIDVTRLFRQLYETFTGTASDGFTLLEFSYSVGVGLGILIFFHHFSKSKKATDPTPLEVEMRTYEDEVDTTLIEADSRTKSTQRPEKQTKSTQGKGMR